MPSWQPNWSDVRFDHAQARHAIDQLRACAALLDSQTERRVILARRAQEEWRGRAREQFDEELRGIVSRAADLVDSMRSLAAYIEQAALDAAAEQRRREAARERWRAENRAEIDRLIGPPLPTPRRTA